MHKLRTQTRRTCFNPLVVGSLSEAAQNVVRGISASGRFNPLVVGSLSEATNARGIQIRKRKFQSPCRRVIE